MFTRKGKSRRGRRFSLEQLESRQLMAADLGASLASADLVAEAVVRERTAVVAPPNSVGNLFANLNGNDLYLFEANPSLKQGVTVSRLANGNILVTGHDPTNSGGPSTLINGLPSAEFAVPGNLYVHLGGGEDQIVFDVSAGAVPSFHNVTINMGADAAPDRIIIWNLATRGSMNITTGGGEDWVFLGGATIGDGFGGDVLTINSGAGVDNVTIKNGTAVMGRLDVQTYGSLSEMDGDLVHFDTEAYIDRDADIRMGGGDDLLMVTRDYVPTVFFGGLSVAGSLKVDLGAGDDEAYLRGVITYGNFSLYTGAGADNVIMDNRPIEQWDGGYFIPRVGGNLEIQTYAMLSETDRDEVRIQDAIIHGSLLARLGGGDDYFLLDDAEIIYNDLNLEMGAGNDQAEISGYVVDHLMAWMGDGNDRLHLGRTWAYRLIADGGYGGYDALTTSPDTSALYLDLYGWEKINGFPTWWNDIVATPTQGALQRAT